MFLLERFYVHNIFITNPIRQVFNLNLQLKLFYCQIKLLCCLLVAASNNLSYRTYCKMLWIFLKKERERNLEGFGRGGVLSSNPHFYSFKLEKFEGRAEDINFRLTKSQFGKKFLGILFVFFFKYMWIKKCENTCNDV